MFTPFYFTSHKKTSVGWLCIYLYFLRATQMVRTKVSESFMYSRKCRVGLYTSFCWVFRPPPIFPILHLPRCTHNQTWNPSGEQHIYCSLLFVIWQQVKCTRVINSSEIFTQMTTLRCKWWCIGMEQWEKKGNQTFQSHPNSYKLHGHPVSCNANINITSSLHLSSLKFHLEFYIRPFLHKHLHAFEAPSFCVCLILF